jgi:phospholipase A-2-activating protein
MVNNNSDLTDEYVLSAQLISDGEPARCVTIHSGSGGGNSNNSSSLELLCGSQGGIISKFILPDYDDSKKPSANDGSDNGSRSDGGGLEIQPGGANTRHPHQITAILSWSSLNNLPTVSSIYVTGCKDGKIRIMDGNTHELKEVLEGHSNAVTSLSWISPQNAQTARPWLVSGSWDGTAKIWDVFQPNNNNNTSSICIGTLSGHENTVSVAGLPAESDSIRKVVTVSAGIAEGNSIRGHTVRIWTLSDNDDGTNNNDITSKIVAQVSNDHSGPMRDVCYDADTHCIYTCSNDGTVKIRSAEDGKCIETLVYPGYDHPMLLSVCVVGDSMTKAVVVGAEDGNVAIFKIGQQKQGEAQVIGHPGCVWSVTPLGSTGDFVSSCHDGNIRIFTRRASLAASAEVLKAFEDAVTEAKAVRSTGPSAEEIAKLPKWEMNALTQGRSEGQVQVFQKDGKAIAAQWSASSRTWIEVGEVTGTNANAGTLNGKQYDHILPIEVDVPGGGVQKLQIGYNNGENPFVTAQQFIDEHMLDQNYLAQIADYIRQRAGESGPTIGMGGGSAAATTGGGMGGPSYASEPAVPMDITPTYDYLPMKGYKTFETGIDMKGLSKVIQKIREFNDSVSSNQLSSGEALDSLANTLSITNRYHSSTISLAELAPLHTMICRWDATHAFPAIDLARIAVLHPDAAKGERRAYWEEILGGALDMCLGLGDAAAKEVAVPMLTMRLIANCYKGGPGSAGAAGILVDKILDCAEACVTSDNKNVRLSVATAILNTSSYMHSSTTTVPSSVAMRVVDVVGAIAGCGKYETEAMVRSLVALGTVLLLPGGCGSEVKMQAKERSVGSMVERVAGGHGEMARAVSKEIMSVLSS